MRAAVYRGKNDLRVEEIETPVPGPGEALVRVDVCGVCPTDVRKYLPDFDPKIDSASG
jgi:L-iditol 2-dehydrogenase